MMVLAESELWFAQSSMSWAISMLTCFCYSASTLWTNFTDILCMHKSFVKLGCTDDVLIPTSCVLLSSWAISWIVTWQSSMSIRRTILISSLFRLFECALLSTKVQLCLKQVYRSLIVVLSFASSRKACRIFWVLWVWVSPSFWQNLMKYLCSIRSV